MFDTAHPSDVNCCCCCCCRCYHPQELKYDIAKTRALTDQHGPSLTAMNQAADAMLLLASDPAAMPQHPDTDFSAAAAAAARSSAAAAPRNQPRTIVTLSFLPPPGSMSDDKMLRLIAAEPVSVLKDWLDERSKHLKPSHSTNTSCDTAFHLFACMALLRIEE